jgi:hypothetical protein
MLCEVNHHFEETLARLGSLGIIIISLEQREKKVTLLYEKRAAAPITSIFRISLFSFIFPSVRERRSPASLIFLIRTWGASFRRTAIIVSTHIGSLGTLRSAPRGRLLNAQK